MSLKVKEKAKAYLQRAGLAAALRALLLRQRRPAAIRLLRLHLTHRRQQLQRLVQLRSRNADMQCE